MTVIRKVMVKKHREPSLRFVRLPHNLIRLAFKETSGSAGMICLRTEEIVLGSLSVQHSYRAQIAIPDGFEGQVRPRSDWHFVMV